MSSRTTRRARATQRPRDLGTHYELLANATTDIILFIDRATLRIIGANAAAEQAYGYSSEELFGLTIRDLREPSTVAEVEHFAALCDRPGGLTFETEHIRHDGEAFPVEVVSRTTVSRGETILVSTIRDITERRRASAQAERLARLLRLTMTSFSDERERIHEILALSARLIRDKHPFTVRLRHVVRGTPGFDWPETAPASDGAHAAEAGLDALCHEIVAADVPVAYDGVAIDASGARHSAIGASIRVGAVAYALLFTNGELRGSDCFREEDRDFVSLIAACIGERLKQSWLLGQMKYHSETDLLTGLPNRAAFRARVNAAIAEDGVCTLAVVDIDGFRHVNTTFGRQTADALLVEVAARLEGLRRESECIGRLGSDSFGVLLRDDRSFVSTRVDALRAAFVEPFGLGDRDGTDRLDVSAGIGVARGAGTGDTFEKLLLRADIAVAIAKSREDGGVAFSSPEQVRAIADADALRAELRHAIAHEELEMVVQPYVELASMRIAAAEALVRWNHPQRGQIAPADFIDFAERNGLMRELSSWIMARTIGLVATLEERDVAGIRISFNVSALDLTSATFAERVAGQLRRYPGVETRLGIEVTESAAMRDIEATATTLAELRILGLHIAIDDFGTGYSSLAYLSRLPVDTMKLDRVFIAQLLQDQHGTALVQTFISLAAEFGYESIAEGVETEAQLDWLRAHGCTMAQGFFIARPMRFDEFRTLLAAERR
ncbi:MAG: hypothetical protein NVS3B7_04300 [Candidatus Elarobacter sp.]